jgi:hypothetical protein
VPTRKVHPAEWIALGQWSDPPLPPNTHTHTHCNLRNVPHPPLSPAGPDDRRTGPASTAYAPGWGKAIAVPAILRAGAGSLPSFPGPVPCPPPQSSYSRRPPSGCPPAVSLRYAQQASSVGKCYQLLPTLPHTSRGRIHDLPPYPAVTPLPPSPPPCPFPRAPRVPTCRFFEVSTTCLQCGEVYQVDMLCSTVTAKTVELPSAHQTRLMEQQQGQAAARWVDRFCLLIRIKPY